jgi:hypothetical protein
MLRTLWHYLWPWIGAVIVVLVYIVAETIAPVDGVLP